MSEISTVQVMELRNMTGAGVMDCKNALIESKGDLELAIEHLQMQGKLKVRKRSGKDVSEGLVGVVHSGYEKAAIIEVNVETDSMARNSDFQDIVYKIANIALSTDGSVGNIMSFPFDNTGITVEEKLNNHIAIVGENIKLSRAELLSVSDGVVASYIHSVYAQSLGKIGVLIALKSLGDKEKLSSIGEQIAMHVAASSPLAISVETIDHSIIAKRRAYYMKEMLDSGKSEAMIEKIVDGKMRKFFKEVVLLSQDFIVDSSKTVLDFLKESEKVVDAPIEVVGMVHFVLGDWVKSV
ncbi:MAG: translation elongation factor Ts [Candidatus Liberibacter europaeus]|nr:translation elongation factor Ts [Candidatus Liberibacter europaeus]